MLAHHEFSDFIVRDYCVQKVNSCEDEIYDSLNDNIRREAGHDETQKPLEETRLHSCLKVLCPGKNRLKQVSELAQLRKFLMHQKIFLALSFCP